MQRISRIKTRLSAVYIRNIDNAVDNVVPAINFLGLEEESALRCSTCQDSECMSALALHVSISLSETKSSWHVVLSSHLVV
jgi:hypothetical protein